jgi:AcrR family transcriptional regulator
MSPAVKSRPYDNSRRTAAAAQTRAQVVAAAHKVFVQAGYDATTLRAVAEEAEVSLSTVKALFANKPRLVSAVRDAALIGDAEPVPLREREWYLEMLGTSDPVAKLRTYAEAVAAIHARVGEIHRLVRDASAVDTAMADLWRLEHEQRRVDVELVVLSLRDEGSLGEDVDVETATDSLWVLGSPDSYWLLTEVGRKSRPAYTTWLHQAMLHAIGQPRPGMPKSTERRKRRDART